jgi:AcrR family transcriptional regulator
LKKVPISDCDVRDPRMKRTRQLLQASLRKLLQEKSLDEIGVQDITGAATVNRATFYDHYTDKFALFNATIASDFHKLLQERNVNFDGTCSSALGAIILAVCDFLSLHGNHTDCTRQSSLEPLMDNAIAHSIRRVILHGLSSRADSAVPREILASTFSWAIYAAAKEWHASAKRQPGENDISFLVQLVLPLVRAGTAPAAKR